MKMKINWLSSAADPEMVVKIHDYIKGNVSKFDAATRVAEKELYKAYECMSEKDELSAAMMYLRVADYAGIINNDLIEGIGYTIMQNGYDWIIYG